MGDEVLYIITTEFEWEIYSKEENEPQQNFHFKILIVGQILILSGTFPDIPLPMNEIFRPRSREGHTEHILVTCEIIDGLLKRTSEGLRIFDQRVEEYGSRTEYIAFFNCYFEDYLQSKNHYLSDFSNVLQRLEVGLPFVHRNVWTYQTKGKLESYIEPEITLEICQEDLKKTKMDIEKIESRLNYNRKRFFRFIDHFFSRIFELSFFYYTCYYMV